MCAVRRIPLIAVLVTTLTAVGLTLAGPALAAAPTITSFTPTSGPLGTTVTVNGANFTKPATVTFAGASATSATVANSTKLHADVPASAVTGPIKVTTSGGTVTSSATFTVTPGLSLAPDAGPPTTTTTVTGSGFAAGEAADVYLDTTDVQLTVTSSTGALSVALTIPSSTTPGAHWITVVGRRSGDAAQASFNVRTNWPQRGFGPARTGRDPYENVLNSATVGGLGQAWSYASGGAITAEPTLVNGVVYFGSDDGSVYAVKASTGAKVWAFATGSTVYNTPAVADGIVYIGSTGGKVYAIKASTGAAVWSFTTGGSVYSSPAVANGVVYVGSFDDKVYALNATTGALLWSYTTGGEVFSSPAVVNGIVYVGSDDSTVYAFNATTGTVVWSYPTGGAVESSPAVANGYVYVGSDDSKVYAFSAGSGQLRWAYTAGSEVFSSPAVANGTVYVGSDDDHLYALDGRTGGVDWSFTSLAAFQSTPSVANGIVYDGDNNGIEFALYYGDVLWSSDGGAGYASSPIVANGAVYAGTASGVFRAYDLNGGSAQITHRIDPARLRPDLSLRRSR
jgi:outer membrane protein assembly factor BamB